MGLRCGIVGLPNVGKSTLFNALTATIAAEAANYPFCTIEPNKGIVSVPDERLDRLATMVKSEKIIPTQIEFIDIAGLVKGASKGEGLGNKFLAHIREVDAIIHVIRCFDDSDVSHVEGSVNPLRDAEIVESELIIADIDTIQKRIDTCSKKLRSNPEISHELRAAQDIMIVLEQEKFAYTATISHNVDPQYLKLFGLLTSKPIMYVLNVEEESAVCGNNYSKTFINKKQDKYPCLTISSKIEAEISALDLFQEKQEFLKVIGLDETGLNKIIKASYSLLGLQTFFTVGQKEARAWSMKKGIRAPEAAGIIHSDFERGFIKAETISFTDYITYDGEIGCRNVGKVRIEGKDYIAQDGDIFYFRYNV